MIKWQCIIKSKYQWNIEDAALVFDDPIHIELFDQDHSYEEDRYIESDAWKMCCLSYLLKGEKKYD